MKWEVWIFFTIRISLLEYRVSGDEKKEQRLLYAENGYTELEMKKTAIMARIITPETFVPVIRLREEAQPEQMKICLELDDPLILRIPVNLSGH